MRAITYARVATIDQQQGAGALDRQERACLDFAQARGWVVVESVQDVASGLSLDRPGSGRVRQLLRDGAADVLMTGARDRLARDPRKLATLVDEIEELGARLELVTERFEDMAVRTLALPVRAFSGEAKDEKSQPRPAGGGRCV
jgi:site-specific DNA recombinase